MKHVTTFRQLPNHHILAKWIKADGAAFSFEDVFLFLGDFERTYPVNLCLGHSSISLPPINYLLNINLLLNIQLIIEQIDQLIKLPSPLCIPPPLIGVSYNSHVTP